MQSWKELKCKFRGRAREEKLLVGRGRIMVDTVLTFVVCLVFEQT
jgi:hypothetical protein